MSLAEGMTPADIGAVLGNKDNDGWGSNGAWWIIILFLFAFMGNGMWGNKTQTTDAVTEAGLCNAMNFNNLENAVGRLSDLTQSQTNTIGNGISDLGYAMQGNISSLGKEVALSQANLGTQIMQSDNALSTQLAQCCCQNRYDALQNANTTQRMIDQTNYNVATESCAIKTLENSNARDIIDNQNNNARLILDKLNEQELNAKQAQIDALESKVNALNLAQSQTLQNQYLLNQLRPAPVPAFTVAQPYFNGGTTFA